ncbi:MAG: cupin domain-containing protein [Phycisphaerae bacterium]|jgi:quercetin dioxygenase-like cupin family protein
MKPNDYLVRFGQLDETSPAEHVRQRAYTLGGQQIRVVEFTRGMQHPEWCVRGHFGYMLEGSLEIEFDHGTIELNPGDGMIIPAGETHRHRPVLKSDRALMLLCEPSI